MLAIHRRLFDRLKNVKAITAGTVAFGVGLTGAAAYVGSGLVYDNFSYEFADPKTSAKVAGASTTTEIKAENGEAGMPGGGSNSSPTPVTSQSPSAGVSVAPSTSSGTGSVGTVVPGRGSGPAPAPVPTVVVPPAPEPTPKPIPVVPPAPETCLCSLLDTVDGTVDSVDSRVDGVVDGLGL